LRELCLVQHCKRYNPSLRVAGKWLDSAFNVLVVERRMRLTPFLVPKHLLVPKLCLGTHLRAKLCFEFRGKETEFGNEETYSED
jgi:hypothetical protein